MTRLGCWFMRFTTASATNSTSVAGAQRQVAPQTRYDQWEKRQSEPSFWWGFDATTATAVVTPGTTGTTDARLGGKIAFGISVTMVHEALGAADARDGIDGWSHAIGSVITSTSIVVFRPISVLYNSNRLMNEFFAFSRNSCCTWQCLQRTRPVEPLPLLPGGCRWLMLMALVLLELLLLPLLFFLPLLPRPALLGNMGAVVAMLEQLLTDVIGFFFKLLKESRRAGATVTGWLCFGVAGSGITG